MQVSRRVHSEVSQEEHLRMGTQRVGTDHAWVSPTERSGGGGGTFDARSRAHVVIDPAEVFGIRSGGVYQGEERDSDRTSVHGSSEELCGSEFLGERLLRIDGRSRRGTDPQLHQAARERG